MTTFAKLFSTSSAMIGRRHFESMNVFYVYEKLKQSMKFSSPYCVMEGMIQCMKAQPLRYVFTKHLVNLSL